MREVKFRAWYEKEKRFLSWGELQDGTESLQTYFNNELSDVSPLMQYTGLKDKNDVEIYEEDNVRYPHIQSFKDVWQVKFHNGSFVIKQGNILICIRDLAYKSKLEVIGNIYENPELLEGE